MYINIHTLQITQHGLRNVNQLGNMTEFVRRGGYFSRNALLAFHVDMKLEHKPALMHIADIEGQLFIHDGHHRAMAIYLSGRSLIFDREFTLRQYTWEDYTKVNLANRWYTPFDPRTHVRMTDLSDFRNMIAKAKGDEELQRFVINHFCHLYKEFRFTTWIHQMANDEAISQYRIPRKTT